MPSPLRHNRNGLILHLASELRPQLSLDVWGSVVKGALRTADFNLAKSVQSLADSAFKALDDLSNLEHQKLCLTYLAAMPDLKGSPGSIPALYQKLLIPLLLSKGDLFVARHDQIVEAFSRLVAAGDDWASATEVVLLAAVALQHDLPQAHSHAMAEDAVITRLHCLMVTALFKAALQQQSQPGSEAKLAFLKSSHDVLQPAVLNCFSASSATDGEAALSILLPAMIAVAEQLGLACRTQFASALWKAARDAMQKGSQGERAALAALVQNVNFLMPSHETLVSTDIRTDPDFWALLRQLLVDGDAFTRKRGRYVIEHAIKAAPHSAQQPWQALLQLLALLEDFALHLIKGAWEPLIQKLSRAAAHVPRHKDHARAIGDDMLVDGVWVALVWQRALTHPSPSIQMYALGSLFHEKKAGQHTLLPMPCLLECVMPAFCRGLIAGQLDQSSGNAFVHQYACALQPADARLLTLQLLRFYSSTFAARLAQPAILQTAVTAAQATATATAAAVKLDDKADEEMLVELTRVAHAAQPSILLQALTDVMHIAILLCPSSRVRLSSFGPLLAELPVADLQPTGALKPAVEGWLSAGCDVLPDYTAQIIEMFQLYFAPAQVSDKESGAADANRLASDAIIQPPGSGLPSSLEKKRLHLSALIQRGAKWVRLILVLADDLSHDAMADIFAQLQEKVVWLVHRPYLAEGVPFRTLTLLTALLEAVPAEATTLLGRHMQQFIHNIASYLGTYMLGCCQVFAARSALTARLPVQPKAVVAISAAAPSVLPASLQAKVSLAHLALQSVLLALSFTTKSNMSSQHNAREVDSLVGSITKLLQIVSRRWQGTADRPHDSTPHVAADLRIEELMAVASCCKTLASVNNLQVLLSPHPVPAEELLLCLLDDEQAQPGLPGFQTSDALSRSKKATWQAIHSLLHLLTLLGTWPPKPHLLTNVLLAAAGDAHTIPSDALLALLGSLRIALEVAASSPVLTSLAAGSMNAAHMSTSSSGHALEGSSAAQNHLDNMVHIVALSAKACWLAVSEQEKLQPAHCQALLEAFFSACLFVADTPAGLGDALHGEEGPLQWLLHQVLGARQRSPRVTVLVALHLAPLFLACPPAALFYQQHIKKLLLFDAKHASPEGGTSIRQSSWDALERLEPGLAGQVAHTHALPRLVAVCLMHRLAHLPPSKPGPQHADSSSPEDAAAAGELGQRLYASLLSEPVLQVVSYQVKSAVHRSKVRTWQALAVLSAFIPAPHVQPALAQLWPLLQGKDVSSVRQYIESIVVNLMLQCPVQSMEQYVVPSLQTYHAKHHDGITSAVLVGAHLVRHAPAACQQDLWQAFVAAAWPWTMWHHHAIRTFAQLVLHQLLEDFPEAMPEVANQLPSPWRECLKFFRTNPDMQRLEKSLAPVLRSYQPHQAITPAGVFYSGCQLAGSSEDKVGLEGAPLTLLDTVTTFLNTQRAALRQEASGLAGCITTGASGESVGQSNTDFQRKMMPLDHLIADLDVVSGGGHPCETKRQELILVASLVDKVPNLAGLTRTCEVFGAAALAVSDMRITTDPLFSSISVTAEQWMPLLEVPEANLSHWMVQKRAEGYRLIGVEQTAGSTLLPEFTFPSKSVLLLGREREGIPLELLQLLDHTVEIPQLGVIRSLNVHVSGAIALYEYSRQQHAQQQAKLS
ncbi:hypothetical protein WJX77_011015 [Trebouxia sp. C0004]